MSTIRIYQIANLLELSSQQVIELLHTRHRIDVKSASGSIEEIVATQFARRVAKERGIELPHDRGIFDSPPKRTADRPGRPALVRKPDPALVKPRLGPPRLVKTAKAARQAAQAQAADETEQTQAAAEVQEATPPPAPPPAAERPAPPQLAARPRQRVRGLRLEGAPAAERLPEPIPATAAATALKSAPAAAEPQPTETAKAPSEEPPVTATPPAAAAEVPDRPAAAATAAEPAAEPPLPAPAPTAAPVAPPAAAAQAAGAPAAAKPRGRFVPPTLRLRVEEPRSAPAVPTTPRAVRTTTLRPPASQAPLGGPRPLPAQPVRPQVPRPLPPRPAVGYRPPPRPFRTPGRRTERRAKTPVVVESPPPPITRAITLAEGMTVKDMADRLDVRAKEVMKKLLEKRLMLTINTTLDAKTATMIAREFGAEVTMRTFEQEMVEIEAEDTSTADLVPRAPVVTVMGHVDHGKTSLLDAIRKTRVAEREAGGITQHIGASSVPVDGRRIIFLDTPGHEAFTAMRARGAKATDVVVLVVAADDGVMPQTREAINHAQAADVPVIVAINKIDKSNADPERVRRELADSGLNPEEWGGQTVMENVSASQNENLDALLESILLVADLAEHKANPKRAATGTVLEAKIDRGRGPVATILVQDGTLNVGDNFIAGAVDGRVRAMLDDRGTQVHEAGPSSPVEVLGLTGLPLPGDAFQAVADAAKARQIALLRQGEAKEKALGGRGPRVTLETLQQQLAEGEGKQLAIIIKADVQGSAEVLAESLSKLEDERVKIRIIHTGVGAISESDVLLASASGAIVIGFNVRPDRNAALVAENEGVDIRKHSVIYNVTDEVKQAMAGLLEPTFKEQQVGLAEVQQIFKVPKLGTAAGCLVTTGRITRSGESKARLTRDGVVVHEGTIASLRRFKDDVTEVKAGTECGIAFERFADIKPGDEIEVYTIEKVAATA